MSAEPGLRAALTRDLALPPAPEAARLAADLARQFGPSAAALVHYGSHAHGGAPGAGSAHDFFVVVDDYATAYRALARAGALTASPGLAASLNRVLPPNVVALHGDDRSAPVAKCAVLSRRDLVRACSARPRDQFVRGRLFQPVRLAWVRDEEARETVAEAVALARALTFEWGRPFLPHAFDAGRYYATLLEVSYRAEIRPEDPDHVARLVAAQRADALPGVEALLDALAAEGHLVREGAEFRQRRRPGMWTRARTRAYLAASKARATLRWGKYVALYEGWLDYVVGKVERRSGVRIELTPRERRWPLLFLWPRAFRFIGSRPQRRR